ncbi:MAG TPA: 1-acyl-sn-glycerol-3-phosphate acyltransferase [Alphaproteobacteria bacterium]|nr:1-acyl-sn-glycerol-3-phosphate acyltransferase [Alphaproteobacteria bacterium]
MGKIRKRNLFSLTIATLKMLFFCTMILLQLPVIYLLPRGRISVRYMKFFMRIFMLATGIRFSVHGKLSKSRPLLVVSNHISLFEMAPLSAAFGCGFFGKKEAEKYPVIGWVSKRFNVIFLDRRPIYAFSALRDVRNQMGRASYPMFLFPEGTTTNGSYVKKFKSSLFDFIDGSNVTVQPIVISYKYRDGTPIDDDTLAEHFAYFNNVDQDMGPKCSRERSAFAQIFHLMMLGGFKLEVTVLPVPPREGLNRKQIAEVLQKNISDKYMELKDK